MSAPPQTYETRTHQRQTCQNNMVMEKVPGQFELWFTKLLNWMNDPPDRIKEAALKKLMKEEFLREKNI